MNIEFSTPTALEVAPGYLHRAPGVEWAHDALESLSWLGEPTMHCTSVANASQGFPHLLPPTSSSLCPDSGKRATKMPAL